MDMALAFKAIAAFIFVIALMMGLPWFLKKLGIEGQHFAKGGKRRLKLVETMPVDHKTRLVLVRRDDREHLILIGADHAAVVEKDIPAVADNIVELPLNKELKND